MITIYVLECEQGKFYIGRTERNIPTTITEHFNQDESEWTTKYKSIRIIETIRNADSLDEDKYTKIYMQKYGIENVRGGSYNTLHLPPYKLKCLEDEIATAENRCFRCGRMGHFINECFARSHKDGSKISQCFRCGRNGHYTRDCHAKTHKNGAIIESYPGFFSFCSIL